MYEYRQSSFNILPPVIKNLIILNVLMFLLTLFYEDYMIRHFALFYVKSSHFRPMQFVTHMFMHGGFLHIFSNMFALWMFGSKLENLWGPKRFLFFYFFCGLGAAALHSVVTYVEINYIASVQEAAMMWNTPTVGASGAVFGVLLAFGMVFPNTELLLLFPPIPIKAKYFVFFYAIFELYAGLNSFHGGSDGGINIAHFAHIGGMLFGFILLKYWSRNRRNLY